MVDALVLGTSGATRGGSSPLLRTIKTEPCAQFFAIGKNKHGDKISK